MDHNGGQVLPIIGVKTAADAARKCEFEGVCYNRAGQNRKEFVADCVQHGPAINIRE